MAIPLKEIIVHILECIQAKNKQLYALVGLTNDRHSDRQRDSFSHRPYYSKAETWGVTTRCSIHKILDVEDTQLRVEIWSDKFKIGQAIVDLKLNATNGFKEKIGISVNSIGEVQVSIQYNIMAAVENSRLEQLESIFGKSTNFADIDLSRPRHERPYWKAYLDEADKLSVQPISMSKEDVLSILKGNSKPMTRKNEVRVFISSTFTDTEAERNQLMVDVYPFLSRLCQKLGLEFNTVDMRWVKGVREYTNDNHQTSELCMKELRKCRQQSVGPAFMCLLGNKITHSMLSSMWEHICAEELGPLQRVNSTLVRKIQTHKLETILGVLDATEIEVISRVSKLLLIPKWFLLNRNSKPPVFELQTIPTYLPNFRSTNPEEQKLAEKAWWEIFASLQLLLQRGASVLKSKDQERFTISVTNEEVFHGILDNPNIAEQVVVLSRQITDVERISNDELVKRFVDASSVSSPTLSTYGSISSTLFLDCEAASLLAEVKDKVSRLVGPKYQLDYVVNTQQMALKKGEKPEGKAKQYLQEMCEEVCGLMVEKIFEGFRKNVHTSALVQEVTHHHSFLSKRLRAFVERDQLQEAVMVYCKQDEAKYPFVIHAESGAGKTALMAWVANNIRQLHPSSIVITRFLGTTPSSSDVLLLMRGICEQLQAVFEHTLEDDVVVARQGTLKEVSTLFKKLISLTGSIKQQLTLFEKLIALTGSRKQKLYLFIDSLDQLLPSNNASLLDWLPVELPPLVNLVVSVLVPDKKVTTSVHDDRHSDLLDVLRKRYSHSPADYFLQIPKLNPTDAQLIIDKRLELPYEPGFFHTLTEDQRRVILQHMGTHFTPLFLHTSIDLALQWKSYTPLRECTLETSTRETILKLFRRLEGVHGRILVSCALGYLAASQFGLSDQDMEDILSCDDVVLKDVYQRWTPPIRRLPPLLWKRLKEDLSGYLVDKGIGTVTVSTWFHRQFKEAAEDKYLARDDLIAKHLILALYFDGSLNQLDRLISPQPLRFSETKFNTHKITNLPFHQAKCLNPSLFETSLYNLEFIECKIHAGMIGELFGDYELALSLLTASQDRIDKFSEHIVKLEKFQIFLKSNLNILHKNPSMILMLSLNQPDDSQVMVEANKQRSKNCYSHRKLLVLQNKKHVSECELTIQSPSSADMLHFADNDKRIVSHHLEAIKVWDAGTGLELYSIPRGYYEASTFVPGHFLVVNGSIYDIHNCIKLYSFDLCAGEQFTTIFCSPDHTRVLVEIGFRSELWDFTTNTLLYTLDNPWRNPFSPDGNVIATYKSCERKRGERTLSVPEYCKADSVLLTDVHTGRLLHELKTGEQVRDCVFTSNGANVILAYEKNYLRIWDLATGTQVTELSRYSVMVLGGNRFMVQEQGTNSNSIWEYRDSLQYVDSDSHLQQAALEESKRKYNHPRDIRCYCVSDDGKKLLTAKNDNTIKLWDVTKLAVVDESSQESESTIRDAVCSPAGMLATMESKEVYLPPTKISIWDLSSMRLISTLQPPDGFVGRYECSPSLEYVAFELYDDLQVFSTSTRSNIGVLLEIKCWSFSSKDVLAVTRCPEYETSLWDCKTWNRIDIGFDITIAHVTHLAFSPCGTYLAAGFKTLTFEVAVWDLQSKVVLSIPEVYHAFNFTAENCGLFSKWVEQYVETSHYCRGYGVLSKLQGMHSELITERNNKISHQKLGTRAIIYNNEIWSYAQNEIVYWEIGNGGFQQQDQFIVPHEVTCLARHGHFLICGTKSGLRVYKLEWL